MNYSFPFYLRLVFLKINQLNVTRLDAEPGDEGIDDLLLSEKGPLDLERDSVTTFFTAAFSNDEKQVVYTAFSGPVGFLPSIF